MNNPREAYPEFIYESCEITEDLSEIIVNYTYRLGEHEFHPTVRIPHANIRNKTPNKDFLEYLFFNFGIINAINYYKLSCAPNFIIKAGKIDQNQAAFFKKLFYNGLGEFMYVNHLSIPYENFMTIISEEPEQIPYFDIGDNFSGNLIPVGGGKDSIVTLEALKPMYDDNLCFQYNRNIYPPNAAALECISYAGYKTNEIAIFNLTLDQHMLELNSQGFYNGHIPFSGCLAFASIIAAYLNNKKYIVLSNESSANEGNIAGTTINHQYSKSFEFEQDFRAYTSTYLTTKIEYFSLLRCYNEYTIVKKFLKNPTYLKIFRSCNVGTKENTWCGHCAKCLYVFIMLYPFVPIDRLEQIFGNNMLDNEDLVNIFVGLVDPIHYSKPFECVGTEEEINYALKLALDATPKDSQRPKLLEYYAKNFYNPMRQFNVEYYFNPQHNIPTEYLKMLEAV